MYFIHYIKWCPLHACAHWATQTEKLFGQIVIMQRNEFFKLGIAFHREVWQQHQLVTHHARPNKVINFSKKIWCYFSFKSEAAICAIPWDIELHVNHHVSCYDSHLVVIRSWINHSVMGLQEGYIPPITHFTLHKIQTQNY